MNAQPNPSTLTAHPAKAVLLGQIQALEIQLVRLEDEKAGYHQFIDQYYRLLRRQLGDLLAQTAELQMKLAFQRARQTGRRSDSEEAQTWRERFTQTNRVIQEAIAHQPVQLDETDERELRRLYRQAVTLAHPDRYANDPDRMDQATAFMVRLNEAYKRQDLAAVRQLTRDLNEGYLFTSQAEANYDLGTLQQWYDRLVQRQTKLQAEINELKSAETYRLMLAQTDLTSHFAELRVRMLQQIQHLRQQLYPS